MKPTLVFLHGFPLDSEMWKNQKEFFKDYPIFCPDLLGTFNRPDSLFTLDEMAETVYSEILISQKKIILCGLSMGGYIAQRLVELYPENLIGLILISTRSAGDSNQAKINRTKAINKIKKEGLFPFLNSFIKNLITKSNAENKDFFEAILNITNRQPKDGIISELLALQGRVDSESFLPNIKIPSLILAGEEDLLSPPSEMREIFRKIPKHEFFVIKNSAHLAPMENPEEV
ncbi:MAG: alpha/beta hydrolase, partial [Spirochaetia bacterium]|nr:alpha/beta hydrolase [Spirochaetia bacterium]